MRKKIGLYIHIPFCVRKCLYCDFLSVSTNYKIKKEYITALLSEIESYKYILEKYKINSIYIGGGTPSSLDAEDIVSVLDQIKEICHLTDMQEKEITIEVNPGTITREKLIQYQMAGINRLSIGLQSTNNIELKLLGRIHTYEEFEENFNLARECGFRSINVDLMFALPHQTKNSWVSSLEKVVKLQPEHISTYSLILEEGTPFYEKYKGETAEKELPSEEVEREMYYQAKEILEQAGYVRYEISNYAKYGYEAKHNSSYWKRMDYIGFGLGASSCLENQRYENTRDLDEYLKNASDFRQLKRNVEDLGRKRRMEEFMFLGLRLRNGIRRYEFEKEFSCTVEEVYGPILEQLKEKELIEITENHVKLSEYGIDVSNYVFSHFLLE